MLGFLPYLHQSALLRKTALDTKAMIDIMQAPCWFRRFFSADGMSSGKSRLHDAKGIIRGRVEYLIRR